MYLHHNFFAMSCLHKRIDAHMSKVQPQHLRPYDKKIRKNLNKKYQDI